MTIARSTFAAARPRLGTLAIALAIASALLLGGPAPGQPAPADAPAAAAPGNGGGPEEAIAARRQTVAEELERVNGQLAAAGDPAPEHLTREADLIKRLELLLNQQLATLQQTQESKETHAELEGGLAQLRNSGPVESKPYSLLLLDSVRNELHTLRGRVQTVEAGVAAATEARKQSEAELDKREAARRRAREAFETNTDDAKTAELTQALRAAELESRLATEQLHLRRLELERQSILKTIFEMRITFLQEREHWIAGDTVFTSADLRTKIVEVEAKEEQLRSNRDLQQVRAEMAQREWFDAKGKLESTTADNPALVEEVAARRLLFQMLQREVAVLNKRLDRLASMKEMWNRRFQLRRADAERAVISEWDAQARDLLEALDTEYKLVELELRDLRKDLVTLQNRFDELETGTPTVAYWIRRQIEFTNALDEVYEANATSIDNARRLAERLLGDIGAEMATVSWSARFAAIWKSVTGVWQFEITSVDDRSITVGKIVVGLVVLFTGYFLARLFSTWLGRRVLPRVGLNEGAIAAIRSIVFYVLLVCLVFIALHVINVPLTAFTILGGAVAIGVGFGSQNIMNNFMSGLILIAERPIRVGDLIQLGDLYGIVQHIGARSTRVLTGDNVEIVVPNSSFLENNVINWTLSETKVRIHVSLGVAYGSATREVARLLRKAVEEHGRVLKSPAPIVLFTDFGDNALHFEVHFWIMMRTTMDRRTIESDVRYRIDGLFREGGIVIAFPQRDVHVHAARPLEVQVIDRVVRPEREDGTPGADAAPPGAVRPALAESPEHRRV